MPCCKIELKVSIKQWSGSRCCNLHSFMCSKTPFTHNLQDRMTNHGLPGVTAIVAVKVWFEQAVAKKALTEDL